MSQEEHALLLLQLRDAIRNGEPVEIITLAGLVARHDPDEPLLALVRSLGIEPPTLAEAVASVLDEVRAIGSDDGPAETWDVLCQLDELAAGLVLLGDPGAQSLVEQAISHISAFPSAWAVHADVATEALMHGALRPGEPSQHLWEAVEASRFEIDQGARASASAEVFVAAGIAPVLPLWSPTAQTQQTAAHWQQLGVGVDWELALTADEQGAPVLVLAGAEGHFVCSERAIEPAIVGGDLVARAEPGEWLVRVGEESIRFELQT